MLRLQRERATHNMLDRQLNEKKFRECRTRGKLPRSKLLYAHDQELEFHTFTTPLADSSEFFKGIENSPFPFPDAPANLIGVVSENGK